jgi:hypothetical protein
LGWVHGRNVYIDHRWAGGDPKTEIDQFVMAITSAEATVWHTAPHKWL